MDKAVGLAAKILDELDDAIAGLTLVPGEGGIFDVVADGRVVHSKDRTGRFPEAGDVIAALRP